MGYFEGKKVLEYSQVIKVRVGLQKLPVIDPCSFAARFRHETEAKSGEVQPQLLKG